MNRIKVTHIITGLSIGGAEKVLSRLLSKMDREKFENNVISLTDLGPLSTQLIDAGINVSAMNFLKGKSNMLPMAHLGAVLREANPDIVQTWMYHADLIGGAAARLATKAPVVWNLRQSTLDKIHSKPSTIKTAMACARLSSALPNTIVCGSEAARHVHTALGYDATKMVVLHNGFDTQKYKHSTQQRSVFRANLGLGDDIVLIGNPSRYDPQKDHLTFLQSAAQVGQIIPNAHFVLCGENITLDNSELRGAIQRSGLTGRVHILGIVDDMSSFYSAIDILTLSSAYGEGAPNVLGEAMSSGVPCVATSVGDSSYIIGDTGAVVPARTPTALADALIQLSQIPQDDRHRKGLLARTRIQQNFPLATMIDRYEDLYRRVYSQRYDF